MRVKHHIPGRIRLGFGPGILKNSEAKRLASGRLELPDWVTGYRLNPAAGSIVIEYDEERINPELLLEFLQSTDNDRTAELVEHFNRALTNNQTQEA
ncbi:MAG: heavy-metal-associated domain-containing protein [Deltaproteobacteria bacterium]|nr:heavy-metal-associated domain-containing protein [Deltaproteobacteria bacterium]